MAGPADYNTMENDREALMKLFHLSDLHIGKRVNEFSMIEDQKYILSQILHAAKRERPDTRLHKRRYKKNSGRSEKSSRCRKHLCNRKRAAYKR